MFRFARALCVLSTVVAISMPAAELTVSELEIATIGSFQGDKFILSSITGAELSVKGGYKFGGTLRFAFASGDVEKALAYAMNPPSPLGDSDALDKAAYNELVDRLNKLTSLSFDLAKISVRQPFDWPLEVDYFVGTAAVFCSGEDFIQRFGIASPATGFRGYAYYPQGVSGDPTVQFDGIHAVSGTGFAFTYVGAETLVPIMYLYQDASVPSETGVDIKRGLYSGDVRLLVNHNSFKAELFAGATLPYSSFGVYRAGLLFYAPLGNGVEFMGQAGITYWDPASSFGLDNQYFLIEPRIDLGFASIVLSVFYLPRYYLLKDTGVSGAIDINFKVLLGDLRENNIEGGVESTIGVRKPTMGNDSFKFRVSPFFGLVTEGVRWDFKLMISPLPLSDPLEMIQTYIGIRTAY